MKKNKYKNYKTYSTDSTISSQFNSYGKTHDDTTNYEQILKKNQNENSFFKKAAFKSSTIAIDNVPTCMEYPNPFDTSGSTSPYDKPNPRKLNKDYNNLVKDFEFVKPYSKSNGLYPSDTLCIMCRVNQPLNVLFPCLHKCVCSSCIKMHNITSMSHAATVSGAWSACPACMSEISLILPHTGQEESQYWEWAYEIKPYLPSYFAEEFKRAAKDLKRYGDSAKNDVESQKNTTTKGSTSKCSIL